MKTIYSYTMLRYVHDALTGEYVNVGVVLYAPAAKVIQAKCTQHYGRLSRMFVCVEGEHIRNLLRYIQNQVNEAGQRLQKEEITFAQPAGVMEIAAQILPADDSSLQWSPPGGGMTDNLDATMESLYSRLVARYEEKVHAHGRNDEDVMRSFRGPLVAQAVLPRLHPKLIAAKDHNDEYKFKYAWQNRTWHVYEPVSFDLLSPEAIIEKARRWSGLGNNLSVSDEPFQLSILLGEPHLDEVKAAYAKAENMLHRMPIPHVFVREHDAEAFARDLAAEMKAHDDKT